MQNEEDFAQNNVRREGAHPFLDLRAGEGNTQLIQHTNHVGWMAGWLKLTASAFNR